MSTAEEAPWQALARRKQAYRQEQLSRGVSIQVPSHLLPKDPPKFEDGPQNVLKIPEQLLSKDEFNITQQSVASLLSNIRNGNVSAQAAAEAFCKRASIAQQLTNCLTEPLFENAVQRAKELDSYLKRKGKPIGPLHGLPISIKDGFHIKGVDSSIGIAALCFKPAASNAPLVDLLLSLGCVIIAKTNIPQTLSSLDSINNVFGRTMNPINRLCTAGGSSGGEGVLVAMRGSAIGIGTDIGGSIRVPAMCNGVYGFKPSDHRIPYGGQQGTGIQGISRTSVQAVAGPIARSMDDIDTLMKEIIPRASLFGEDCVSKTSWSVPRFMPFRQRHHHGSSITRGSGPQGEFVIGVLRSDNNCALLPPISNLMNEVSQSLRNSPGIKILDLPTPPAWQKAQSVMSKLMSVEGAGTMASWISSTSEPLVPWMSTRFRSGKPQPLPRVADLQAQRSALEHEFVNEVWSQTDKHGRRTRRIDALICPVAPHPVPLIDSYNAVGYTSSWVLFDYPAGTVPVRPVNHSDLELGKSFTGPKVLGSWDEKNRELWDEAKVDRLAYLDTPLSVQVVTGKMEDEKLAYAMKIVDWAVHPENRGLRRWKTVKESKI